MIQNCQYCEKQADFGSEPPICQDCMQHMYEAICNLDYGSPKRSAAWQKFSKDIPEKEMSKGATAYSGRGRPRGMSAAVKAKIEMATKIYQAGASLRETGRQMGVSAERVRQWLEAMKIPRRPTILPKNKRKHWAGRNEYRFCPECGGAMNRKSKRCWQCFSKQRECQKENMKMTPEANLKIKEKRDCLKTSHIDKRPIMLPTSKAEWTEVAFAAGSNALGPWCREVILRTIRTNGQLLSAEEFIGRTLLLIEETASQTYESAFLNGAYFAILLARQTSMDIVEQMVKEKYTKRQELW